MKLSEMLVKITNETIYSPEFKDMARKLSKYFTRNRKMPFEDLMIFMLFHLKCSIPSSLRRYFKTKDENITMSQQSLSEARDKLTVDAFKHLYIKIHCQQVKEIQQMKYKLNTKCSKNT